MNAASAEAFIDAAPVPMIGLLAGEDGDWRITRLNAEAETLLGRSRQSLANISLWSVLLREPALEALLARAATIGEAHAELRLERLRPETEPVAVALSGARLARDDKAELAVVLRPRRLRLLGRVDAPALRASGLSALIAHEVRNPLAGLKGAAQYLARGAAANERALLDIIIAESDRIARLIDRLEGATPPDLGDKKPVNVHEALQRARIIALSGFAERLRVEESYDPSLPMILAHEDLLIQALINLLKNAAEASFDAPGAAAAPVVILRTRARSGVRFGAERGAGPQGGVEIAIIDHGAGVPADLRDQIFAPFVTTKPRGAGLGLAVVAEAAAAHGGAVECDSRPGLTQFRLILPFPARRPRTASAPAPGNPP